MQDNSDKFITRFTHCPCFSPLAAKTTVSLPAASITFFLTRLSWDHRDSFLQTNSIKFFVPEKADTLYKTTADTDTIGTLRKPRRQRQRERHQTKGLMSTTMAVHTCVLILGSFLCHHLSINHIKWSISKVLDNMTNYLNFSYFYFYDNCRNSRALIG